MHSSTHVEWRADPYWHRRRLSPAQLLVYDIGIQQKSDSFGPILEINEVLPSSFIPALQDRDRLSSWLSGNKDATRPREHEQMQKIVDEYGWMNCLRLQTPEKENPIPTQPRSCRWVHISSTFPEYLHGCLLGFGDWTDGNIMRKIMNMRHLEQVIYQNERFSKHGRYFSPFFESLAHSPEPHEYSETGQHPLLVCLPFVDWTVVGETPPLRFQIDPREGFQSSRTSVHLIRSLLQHFYRLEDTHDREQSQVFANHRPWTADTNLDLKVRRWYGHYPESLNVDELWVLVVDAQHIITFASNQSWKSRWPPLQLASRIAEVSFRSVRNDFFTLSNSDYTAYHHLVTCLNGAVGLLHRSFWPDMPLCIADRYAGYLEHVQYRLHRAPNSKLVMDLLQLQEELHIVIQITKQQLDLITELRTWLGRELRSLSSRAGETDPHQQNFRERRTSRVRLLPQAYWGLARQHGATRQADPISQLLENLNREYNDMFDLRESTSSVIERTIKLVNLRLEDHGKAILVFTVVTVIFLPLSFISSYFGMNFADIRDMEERHGFFWIVAGSATIGVVALSVAVAFFGGPILDRFLDWKENRHRQRRRKRFHAGKQAPFTEQGIRNFAVLDTARM